MLQRATAAGVAACVITGTCEGTSRAAAELCVSELGRQHNLYFTAGVHPHNAKVRGSRGEARAGCSRGEGWLV